MYRFALRPRWILSHLFVLALVALMVNFGFWQLRRLDDRRDTNARIEQRAQLAEVELGALVSVEDPLAVGDDLAFRAVRATGAYDRDGEVLVRNRTLDGQPGYWVLTPLMLDGDDAVIVNRGWVPLRVGEAGVPLADAPTLDGEVTVRGTLSGTQERGSMGPTDASEGKLEVLSRADIARIDAQTTYGLLPVVLQLTVQDPPAFDDLPRTLPMPETDEGPHLSYAVQWFIFSSIGVVGYPLVLRRVARTRTGEATAGAATSA